MLGGGQTYQIPEVLKEQSYGKSVDIYLFGLLMYEVLTGCAAFPCFDDLDEHEERIKNCEFCFPGDEQFNARCKKYSGYLDADRCNMLMSSLAKDLISNLIKSDSKQRMPIQKIKKHKWFTTNLDKMGMKWSDIEKGQVTPPNVHLQEPLPDNFDEIQYDSDDQDFQHEFTNLYNNQYVANASELPGTLMTFECEGGDNNTNKNPSMVPSQIQQFASFNQQEDSRQSLAQSQDSKFYDQQPFEFDEGQPEMTDNFDDLGTLVKIPGFSFVGKRDTF